MVQSFRVALNDAKSFTKGGIACPDPNCDHVTIEGTFNRLRQLADKVLPDPQKRTDEGPFNDLEIQKSIISMNSLSKNLNNTVDYGHINRNKCSYANKNIATTQYNR